MSKPVNVRRSLDTAKNMQADLHVAQQAAQRGLEEKDMMRGFQVGFGV